MTSVSPLSAPLKSKHFGKNTLRNFLMRLSLNSVKPRGIDVRTWQMKNNKLCSKKYGNQGRCMDILGGGTSLQEKDLRSTALK
jgi:hypothetical protein